MKIVEGSFVWDKMKCNNICIIGVSEEKEQEIKKLFEEIITENFPNLVKQK